MREQTKLRNFKAQVKTFLTSISLQIQNSRLSQNCNNFLYMMSTGSIFCKHVVNMLNVMCAKFGVRATYTFYMSVDFEYVLFLLDHPVSKELRGKLEKHKNVKIERKCYITFP